MMFCGQGPDNGDCCLYLHRSGDITMRHISPSGDYIEVFLDGVGLVTNEAFDFFDRALTWDEQKTKAPVTSD